MTLFQYVDLVFVKEFYTEKEFLRLEDSIVENFLILEPNFNGTLDFKKDVSDFFSNHTFSVQELYNKFLYENPVKIKFIGYDDFSYAVDADRYRDINYPIIKVKSALGKSLIVFISPADGSLRWY